jgi:hypothetical protein
MLAASVPAVSAHCFCVAKRKAPVVARPFR